MTQIHDRMTAAARVAERLQRAGHEIQRVTVTPTRGVVIRLTAPLRGQSAALRVTTTAAGIRRDLWATVIDGCQVEWETAVLSRAGLVPGEAIRDELAARRHRHVRRPNPFAEEESVQ